MSTCLTQSVITEDMLRPVALEAIRTRFFTSWGRRTQVGEVWPLYVPNRPSNQRPIGEGICGARGLYNTKRLELRYLTVLLCRSCHLVRGRWRGYPP